MTVGVDITYESARAALRKVANERPDHKQEHCWNFTLDGEPCCVVGTALSTILVPEFTYEKAVELECEMGCSVANTLERLRRHDLIDSVDHEAQLLLMRAQTNADGGMFWGRAVRLAEMEVVE